MKGNVSAGILLLLLASFLIAMGVSPKGQVIYNILFRKGSWTYENK